MPRENFAADPILSCYYVVDLGNDFNKIQVNYAFGGKISGEYIYYYQFDPASGHLNYDSYCSESDCDDITLRFLGDTKSKPLIDWHTETMDKGSQKTKRNISIQFCILKEGILKPVIQWDLIDAFPISFEMQQFGAVAAASVLCFMMTITCSDLNVKYVYKE